MSPSFVLINITHYYYSLNVLNTFCFLELFCLTEYTNGW